VGNILVTGDIKAQTIRVTVNGDGTLTAIYAARCCRVGGVVAPVNPLITLAPYLALIGLVVAAGVAVTVKRRRKN